MAISITHKRKVQWIGVLLVALLITSCAGIKPYEPRDNREEGPEKGIFTGSEGEFVIFRKADEPETGSQVGKSSDVAADGQEKKGEAKSGKQQP